MARAMPRRRQRLFQSVAVLLVAVAGVWGYHHVVRPDRMMLLRLADAELRAVFGPEVEYGSVKIDLLRSVTIEELAVRTSRTDQPTLQASRVVLRHDLLALASGIYRPVAIEIDGARIVTRETETGAAFDFPLHLSSVSSGSRPPRVNVRDARVLYRARVGSERLQEGGVLVLDGIRLEVTPETGRRVLVEGSFQTRGLGQDEVDILIGGWADLDADTLQLQATWDPLRLTPDLLAHVADSVAAPLERQVGQKGRLAVTLTRDPEQEEGRLRIEAGWSGSIHMDLQSIPGVELIDAEGLEQIQSLISSPTLDVVVSQEGVDIRGLVAGLGGGDASLTGQILDGGETIRLDMGLRGVRLEDPALREALSPGGQRALDAFVPRGIVDAAIRVRKEKGKDLAWTVDAILEDASFKFVGYPDDTGYLFGFPYPVESASGGVHIQPGLVFFDDIVGIGGGNPDTSVSILGWRRSSWAGGPTGRIRLTEAGPDIRLTVVGRNLDVDDVLAAAVAGSEFAEDSEKFQVGGTLDKIEVDIMLVPGRDERARTEVRLTLSGETFRYVPFPLFLEDVDGWVTLRKPWVSATERGKVFQFDATGRVEGAPVRRVGHARRAREPGPPPRRGPRRPARRGADEDRPRGAYDAGRDLVGVALPRSPGARGRQGRTAPRGPPGSHPPDGGPEGRVHPPGCREGPRPPGGDEPHRSDGCRGRSGGVRGPARHGARRRRRGVGPHARRPGGRVGHPRRDGGASRHARADRAARASHR